MAIAQDTGANSLLGILNLFAPSGGSTTTTDGKTTTTQNNTSTDAVTQAINNMLGGTNGLASLASGEKASGGYNTTTNTMLTNDLLSRTAGMAASLNNSQTVTTTPTTSTTTPTPAVSTSGALTAGVLGLGASLANSLLAPTVKGLSKKLGLDTAGDKIANSILGTGDTTLPSGILGSEGGLSGGGAFTSTGDLSTSPLSAFNDSGTTSFLSSAGFSPSFSSAAASPSSDLASSVGVGSSLIDNSIPAISDAAVAGVSDAAGAAVDTGIDAATGIGGAVLSTDTAAPVIDDAASSAGDWFGGLFADGGQVPKKPGSSIAVGITANMPTSMKTTDTGNRYANGGAVTAGAHTLVDDTGTSVDAVRTVQPPVTTPATSVPNSTDTSSTNNTLSDTDGSSAALGTATGVTGTVADNSTSMANPFGMAASLASIGMATTPIGLALGLGSLVSNAVFGKSAISALASAVGVGNANITTDDVNNAIASARGSTDTGVADTAPASASVNGFDSSTFGISDAPSDNPADAMNGENSAAAAADAASSDSSADSSAGASAGDSSGASDGSSGGDSSGGSDGGGSNGGGNGGGDGGGGGGDGGGDGGGGGGGGGGDKNGGKIAGHDTKGKDNINIHVSGGEYVVPTDVVDKLGVNFFDQLKAALHTTIK